MSTCCFIRFLTRCRDAAEYDRSVGDYIFNLISSSDSDEYLKEYLEGVK